MTLSIVMPSHNTDENAKAAIVRAIGLARDGVEVIIRDNSGDRDKRNFFSQIPVRCPHGGLVHTEHVPACEHHENLLAVTRAATGDFILFLTDDDMYFERGVREIAESAERCADDATIAGFFGGYVLMQSQGDQIVTYNGIASADPVERVRGYLEFQGPNLLFYSAVRNSVARKALEFALDRHPFRISFNDQLACLLYLLAGKFRNVMRLTFAFDNGHWETPQKAQASDLGFYRLSGLDPAMARLHWLMCGMEGAFLALKSEFAAGCTAEQRGKIAKLWFNTMFARFVGDDRACDGPMAASVMLYVRKWRERFPDVKLGELLADVCSLIAMSDKAAAEQYRKFWMEMG